MLNATIIGTISNSDIKETVDGELKVNIKVEKSKEDFDRISIKCKKENAEQIKRLIQENRDEDNLIIIKNTILSGFKNKPNNVYISEKTTFSKPEEKFKKFQGITVTGSCFLNIKEPDQYNKFKYISLSYGTKEFPKYLKVNLTKDNNNDFDEFDGKLVEGLNLNANGKYLNTFVGKFNKLKIIDIKNKEEIEEEIEEDNNNSKEEEKNSKTKTQQPAF